MQTFWIKFEDESGGSCDGQGSYDAVKIAEHVSGKKVKDNDKFEFRTDDNPNVKTLPYNAAPIIWQYEHPIYGKSPAFCHSPSQCCGHTSCPQSRSCTE